MRIKIKKGLNIPLGCDPEGEILTLEKPDFVALNLDPFSEIRFKVLVKPGESVKRGQPLVESKTHPGQMFVSPAGGTIKEIKRGLKRRLLNIIISVAGQENIEEHAPLRVERASREEIITLLMRGGGFPHIRMRPFDLVADPAIVPRAIFVRALESAPYKPSSEMQVQGNEELFQQGLDVLNKLTSGKVHLVFHEETTEAAFLHAKGVEKHEAIGPYPISNSSVHIHAIDPIKHEKDVVWTLSTIDVITIGSLVSKGIYYTERILSIAGGGIVPEKRGYFRGRLGFPLSKLAANRLERKLLRFISGDPLMGKKVDMHDFLGFYDTVFCALPESTKREFLHFLRPGFGKYTATGTYISRLFPRKQYSFTTNMHGEKRAFVDSSIYDKVMPLKIPTVQLVKAVLAEDFELAERLGLLEVAPEDFALPTFICPSKNEMVEIIHKGLHLYAKEAGH